MIFKYEFSIETLEKTKQIACYLATLSAKGDIFFLNGDIGAGKTTFCQFFINCLLPDERVSSPTFSIINEYLYDKIKIYHMDLYRIKNIEELFELGLDELINNNICLIEWAQNSKGYNIDNPIILNFSKKNSHYNLEIICNNLQNERFKLNDYKLR